MKNKVSLSSFSHRRSSVFIGGWLRSHIFGITFHLGEKLGSFKYMALITFHQIKPYTLSLIHLCLSAFICGSFLLGAVACHKSERVHNTAPPVARTDWPVFRGTSDLRGVTGTPLPERLTPAFTLKAGDSITSSPVIGGGLLYVAAMDGLLRAFDLETRRQVWEFGLADGFEASPLYIKAKNLLVIGGLDGLVYALSADSGRLLWKAETGARIMGSVNVYPGRDGTAEILAGSYDNSLYAFSLDHGQQTWSFETGNYINGAAAVEGDRAVVGGCDAALHIMDLAWGKEVTAVDTGAYIAGSAALADGIAYVGNYAGRFLAIDVKQAAVLWSFSLPDESRGFSASPSVTDKYIVIGAKDKFLYCLDRKTGARLWRYHGSDEFESSSLSDGVRALVFSVDGEGTVLELTTGRLISSYRLGAGVKGSPAFAAGYLTVGALDGSVYVFAGK